jgi:hypothetical protein
MAGAISHHALAFSQSHSCTAKNSRFGKRTGNARLVYLKGRCGSGSRKLGLMWASSSQSSVMEYHPMATTATPQRNQVILTTSYGGYLFLI